eukprot:1295320-Prymnesium_polylepis.1
MPKFAAPRLTINMLPCRSRPQSPLPTLLTHSAHPDHTTLQPQARWRVELRLARLDVAIELDPIAKVARDDPVRCRRAVAAIEAEPPLAVTLLQRNLGNQVGSQRDVGLTLARR